MLRSMSFVMIPPAVSKPIDKGVTSNSSKSCTCEDPSPVRIAACTAAPKSSAKGVYLRHDPLDGCRLETFHSRLHSADGVLIVHKHWQQNHGERKSNSRPHHRTIVIGEEQLNLGNQLFQLEDTWSARYCRRISALAAAAAAVVGVVLAVVGGK